VIKDSAPEESSAVVTIEQRAGGCHVSADLKGNSAVLVDREGEDVDVVLTRHVETD
jgi:hypothetical protein